MSLLQAQTLSGYVYDEIDNIPLEGAFVYLDGTTYSTSTDSLGHYSITTSQKYSVPLIVSYIGYQDMTITNPYQYTEGVNILMRRSAKELEQIVLTKQLLFSREEMLKAFRTNFLGTSRGGRSCNIMNEDDIVFSYDTDTNMLNAKSSVPLQIHNKHLKYNITFNLKIFSLKYFRKSIKKQYLKGIYLEGTTFYTDVSKNNEAYKKRVKAYLGSIPHFMRTLVNGDWKEQKFNLYIHKLPVTPRKYFTITDTLGVKKVTINNGIKSAKPLNINTSGETVEDLKKKQREFDKNGKKIQFKVVYNKNKKTYIRYNTGTFYIDKTGQYFPISELQFRGHMATLKVGDMLPADFSY